MTAQSVPTPRHQPLDEDGQAALLRRAYALIRRCGEQNGAEKAAQDTKEARSASSKHAAGR